MSKSLKLIIEALLFSSDKPLTIKDIRDCLPDTEIKDIKGAITILEHDFEAMERSFSLKEVAGGYQLRSRPEYGAYILRMLQSTPNRLSRAAMETLAIVAYKQPILRHEIEKFRGVDVGGILKTLMEKDLVKIMGRKDLPGKPLIYGTTKRFLEVFDLMDISSLPKMNEIKDFGLSGYEPTPQNQENPLQPQGTEGLYSTIPIPYTFGDIPLPPKEQMVLADKMQEETTVREPARIPDGIPANSANEEDYGSIQEETITDSDEEQPDDSISDEIPDDKEEEYQEMTSDEMSYEADPDYEEEEYEEGFEDLNGDYNPDDDLSENGNEDDPKD